MEKILRKNSCHSGLSIRAFQQTDGMCFLPALLKTDTGVLLTPNGPAWIVRIDWLNWFDCDNTLKVEQHPLVNQLMSPH